MSRTPLEREQAVNRDLMTILQVLVDRAGGSVELSCSEIARSGGRVKIDMQAAVTRLMVYEESGERTGSLFGRKPKDE